MRTRVVLIVIVVLIAGAAVGGWLLTRKSLLQSGGFDQSATAGDVHVTLRIDDMAVGTRVIDVMVADTAGAPVDVSDLRLRFSMLDMNMSQSEIQAQQVGRGHYQARGQFFSMVGNWSVEAVVLRANQQQVQVPFKLAIAGPGESSGPLNPLVASDQTIQAGQRLYATNCAVCHGSTGKGDGPSAAGLNPRPANFTQHMGTGLHTDGQIFLWIKNGFPNSAMPAWGPRLSDDQIWQLVMYLRTFAPRNSATNPTAGTQPTTTSLTPQPQAGQPTAGSTAPQQSIGPTQAPLVPMSKELLPPLVFARSGNVWRSDGTATSPRPLTSLGSGSYAEYPTFSPDGSQIAFVAISPPPITATLPLPTSTLYVMNADGSNLKSIWHPAQGLIGLFSWSADGKSMYVNGNGVQPEAKNSSGGPQLQIFQLDIATGALKPLLADVLDPRLSHDGKQLAYLQLKEDGYSMSLNLAAPDGSGPRELIGSTGFQGFYAPRFTLDDKQIVVAAIGGPPTDPQGHPLKASVPSALDRLLGLFEPPSAEAHGAPWDLWIVNVDGTGLRKLTSFLEDLPMAAFAPDGKQMAIMGLGGIYMMNVDGTNLRKIDTEGDHGGLDWVR